MANKIILKRSSVSGKAPLTSDLDYGELSINYADGTLYYKNSNNSIGTIGSNIANLRVTSNTVSNSSTSGALIVSGGTGIAGNLNVGGNVNVAGTTTLSNIVLPDTSYINSATVYDLDDISYATDGFTNSFRPTYNQNTVTITNPWQLLITVDGAVQPAFDNNYDTIWFGLALTASRGYTVDTTGNIKFADCPAQGSSIMARTVVGSPNPTKKVYPFKPLDILLGS
jgi:hypothetical protein